MPFSPASAVCWWTTCSPTAAHGSHVKLVKQLGGEIAGLPLPSELDFLKGRERFPEYDIFSLLHYDE